MYGCDVICFLGFVYLFVCSVFDLFFLTGIVYMLIGFMSVSMCVYIYVLCVCVYTYKRV